MPEMTTLPEVLTFLAERWPERCQMWNDTLAHITLGGDWSATYVTTSPRAEAATEYLIREIIAEQRTPTTYWRLTLRMRNQPGDGWDAHIDVMELEDNYQQYVIAARHTAKAPTPLLALANALRGAVVENGPT